MIGSGKGIKMVSTDSNVLGTILGNVDGIKFSIDVGTYLGYFMYSLMVLI